jgi:hypothetical protein
MNGARRPSGASSIRKRDPIIVQRGGLKLSDGGHRLVMLEALGYKSAIVREI